MTAPRELPITLAQADLFRQLRAAVETAQQQLAVAASMLCAGHDVEGAVSVSGLGGTREAPTLVIAQQETR